MRVNLMVDGGVTRMQSRPLGTWNTELGRATWTVPLQQQPTTANSAPSSPTSLDASGCIRAKFTLTEGGVGRPQTVALQFCRDGAPLPSGTRLALTGDDESAASVAGDAAAPHYRLTMCKYRLLGDRYFCDPPRPGCNSTAGNPR